MKWSLIQTVPNWIALATRIALPTSHVQTDAARPNRTSFAHAIACSSSLKRWTVTTGPKTSSWTISLRWSGPAMTVGS